MKNSSFSKLAVAAFLLTLGGTAAAKAVRQETIWVYSNGETTTMLPDCLQDNQTPCAEEHFFSNGQIGAPTGQVRTGNRP